MSTAQTITEAAFSQVVPVRCLAPYNHYSHLLIVTLVPLGLIGGFASSAVLYLQHGKPEMSNHLFSAALLVSLDMLRQ